MNYGCPLVVIMAGKMPEVQRTSHIRPGFRPGIGRIIAENTKVQRLESGPRRLKQHIGICLFGIIVVSRAIIPAPFSLFVCA